MCGYRFIVIVAQKTQCRFKNPLRQYAMMRNGSDPSARLSVSKKPTREMRHDFS